MLLLNVPKLECFLTYLYVLSRKFQTPNLLGARKYITADKHGKICSWRWPLENMKISGKRGKTRNPALSAGKHVTNVERVKTRNLRWARETRNQRWAREIMFTFSLNLIGWLVYVMGVSFNSLTSLVNRSLKPTLLNWIIRKERLLESDWITIKKLGFREQNNLTSHFKFVVQLINMIPMK